jgi:CPA1 family monovalent cation:H+ antiporter
MEHGLAIEGVSTIVSLLVAVMVVAVVSKYLRIPYTVALVIAGLAIAISPIQITVDLTPDLILFIFLPALLFESAYHLHFAELKENLRPIALLAVPGVLLTAFFVAVLTHYTTGVSWETSVLFGAIMSATDPVSVLAIFRQLGAPRRLSVIVEGESLFNDGTSLVLFRIVLGVVIAHALGDVMEASLQFLFVVVGGLVLGALIGFGVSLLLSRVNDYLVETTMTLVVAYGTYLLAERVGVSGVIAVVVAALVVGTCGHSVAMSPTTRTAIAASWEFFGFVANSLIFLLIGLEVDIEKLSQYWVPTLFAIGAVLVVRALVVAVSSGVLRFIHRPIPYRWQSVLVWGGLRGSLALAMALGLPLTLGPDELFADRDLILAMTFGVILFSLLVQGLTMAPLLNRLGLVHRTGAQEELETISARKALAASSLAGVESRTQAGELSPEVAQELQKAYSAELEALDDAEKFVAHEQELEEDANERGA